MIRDIGIHHVPPHLADLNDICFNPKDVNDDDLDLRIFILTYNTIMTSNTNVIVNIILRIHLILCINHCQLM